MLNRKEIKVHARASMRYNYWRCVIIAIILVFFITDFTFTKVNIISSTIEVINTLNNEKWEHTQNSVGPMFQGKSNTEIINNFIHGITGKTPTMQKKYKGVIGAFVNNINAAGSISFGILNTFNQFAFDDSISAGILILLGVLLSIFIIIFIKNLVVVGGCRFYMENHMYYSTDLVRIFMPFRVKRIKKQVVTMLMRSIYQFLWWFTIVGGFIKMYSYRLVPYIVAENPDVDYKTAINLSRKMMDGHKWDAFLLDLSFLGWRVGGYLTGGLVDIFIGNPYKSSTNAELYFEFRRQALVAGLEDSCVLNDKYLEFQLDEKIVVGNRYVNPLKKHEANIIYYSANINIDGTVDIYKEVPEDKIAIGVGTDYLDEYFTMPVYFKGLARMGSIRTYSALSYVLMFFTFAFVGWIWEVSYFVFTEGYFVKRGSMFGPWLPIYGFGGVIALLCLHKFVKKPLVVFCSSFVIAGVMEYGTAWYLWETKRMKWWDYTNQFMNLQGRICLEGLLLFSVGCMFIIYYVAPHLDDLYKKINYKVKIVMAIILLILATADWVYSQSHPNTGDGITTASAIQIRQTEVVPLNIKVHI